MTTTTTTTMMISRWEAASGVCWREIIPHPGSIFIHCMKREFAPLDLALSWPTVALWPLVCVCVYVCAIVNVFASV